MKSTARAKAPEPSTESRLLARVAELEAEAAERAERQRIDAALLRIAEAAAVAQDMAAFYRTIHEIVGELMYAANFYIALYEETTERINYPFYVDEVDTDIPDPRIWWPMGSPGSEGVTGYSIRLGEPRLHTTAGWLTS